MRHQPLVNGDPGVLILELFVPPELHLMLGLLYLPILLVLWVKQSFFTSGVVDKILTELKRNVFDKKVGKQFMDAFFKKVG